MTDDELVALALAADPDAPIPDDAVPWTGSIDVGASTLPDWYMPAPVVGASVVTGWRRRAALAFVASLLLIAGSGLCVTYGSIVIA